MLTPKPQARKYVNRAHVTKRLDRTQDHHGALSGFDCFEQWAKEKSDQQNDEAYCCAGILSFTRIASKVFCGVHV